MKLKYYSQVVQACIYTYTKARLQIRTATSVPGGHLYSDRTLENLVWHEEEIEEWHSLLSDLAALSKPWHLRNEVCFWVLQVGRCKTLPPDTATFLHRVLGKSIEVLKSLPNLRQELSNIDGKCRSGRNGDTQLWVEKEAALLGKLKRESLMLVSIFNLSLVQTMPLMSKILKCN